MTLFHYCSTEAFTAIVGGRKLHLAMLDMSNDTMEGRWIHHVLSNLLKADTSLCSQIDRILDVADKIIRMPKIAGFCLSQEPDQLSQWRGYAGDGRGFSIGFNNSYLTSLGEKYRDERGFGFALHEVCYDVDEQRRLLEPLVQKAKQAVDAGAFSYPALLMYPTDEEREARKKEVSKAFSSLWYGFLPLFFECYRFKNPAFREEREWRLTSFSFVGDDANPGKTDHWRFKAAFDRLVPYVEVDLLDLGEQAITHISIGPRNISDPEYLRIMLSQSGFTNVDIRRSSASYR